MASVIAKDIPEEQAMFVQIWNTYKKYYVPENQDAYWKELSDDLNRIISMYKSDLCKELCLAVAAELDRKYQKMKEADHRDTHN